MLVDKYMEIILSTQRTEGSHHHKECMDQIADNPLTIANYMAGRGKDKAVIYQDIKNRRNYSRPFHNKGHNYRRYNNRGYNARGYQNNGYNNNSTIITMDT